jgi:hypothetical protein
VVILVALTVFVAAGIVTVRAFDIAQRPARVSAVGYPSPPASGYYILLPDQGGITATPNQQFSVRMTAITNLPEGTLVGWNAGDTGTCCPPVSDGKIVMTFGDSSCYGPVGDVGNSPGFDVEITARPDTGDLKFIGPGTNGPPEQPPSVIDVLGPHFENLTGDQVVVQQDGSKWLVSNGHYRWPQPECGGDPIPLFGGPKCDPSEYQQQLQGGTLAEAMGDVMGAINQGRMCEFWSVMLPPEVEADHPWPEFADEWRSWLLQQNFSDSQSSADWTTGPLRWQQVGACHGSGLGDCDLVDVLHDSERIASLHLQQLPDYCPSCSSNVVPFWGVTDWTLYGPSTSPSQATGAS